MQNLIYIILALLVLILIIFAVFIFLQKEQINRQNIALNSMFLNLNKNLNQIISQNSQNLNFNLKTINQNFIDMTQKVAKIDTFTQISENLQKEIVNFNKIINNQKLRGNFGEFRLENVIKIAYGENSSFYEMQKKLPTGVICDCAFKISNTKILAIDSKFPLSGYEKIITAKDENELKKGQNELIKNMKKHIDDISSKYILPPLTAEYAVLFLPSEAIFVYVCENFTEILEYANAKAVFLSSPTTLLAMLFNIKLFLKDEMISQNLNEIKNAITTLSSEFTMQNELINKLVKISQNFNDISNKIAQNSAKIKANFDKISEI